MLPIEKQVPNPTLSQRLKELGVKQRSVWYWKPLATSNEDLFELVPFRDTYDLGDKSSWWAKNTHAAFTCAELFEGLPREVGELIVYWEVSYQFPDEVILRTSDISDEHGDQLQFIEDTLADSLAAATIWLIENGYLNVKDI